MRPVPRFWQGLGSPVSLVSGSQFGHEQLRQTLSTPEYYPDENGIVKKNLSVAEATESLNMTGDSSEPEFDPQLVTHGFDALDPLSGRVLHIKRLTCS
jgi:hypothetical protein